MIAAVGAVALLSVLSAAALAATQGDIHLTQRDLDRKKAYAAAQAGIADFSYHLNNDNSYWAKCTNVPEPNAMNDVGFTSNRRTLSGGGEYAIESLPAAGFAKCDKTNSESMIEKADGVVGTFRIRSTGFVGNDEVSLVASYKRASLLDFIYMTNYETSDPLTYATSTEVTAANTNCKKYRREGSQRLPVQPDLLQDRRRNPRPAPHQRRTRDLRNAEIRSRADRHDRGQRQRPGVVERRMRRVRHRQTRIRRAAEDDRRHARTAADERRAENNRRAFVHVHCVSSIVLNGTSMTIESYSFSGTKTFPSSGVVYIANGETEDCNGMVGLLGAVVAVQSHLLERSEVRQRLRERQIQRPADDRRRQRRDHQRQLIREGAGCWD